MIDRQLAPFADCIMAIHPLCPWRQLAVRNIRSSKPVSGEQTAMEPWSALECPARGECSGCRRPSEQRYRGVHSSSSACGNCKSNWSTQEEVWQDGCDESGPRAGALPSPRLSGRIADTHSLHEGSSGLQSAAAMQLAAAVRQADWCRQIPGRGLHCQRLVASLGRGAPSLQQ